MTRVMVDVPDVPYPGGRTTSQFLRTASRNLRCTYSVGGSNLRATIAELLERTAQALDIDGDVKLSTDPLPDDRTLDTAPNGRSVVALSLAERRKLPAVYHQPSWDGTSVPRWICTVCQDENGADSWPCRPAQRNGAQIAEYAGLNATD